MHELEKGSEGINQDRIKTKLMMLKQDISLLFVKDDTMPVMTLEIINSNEIKVL